MPEETGKLTAAMAAGDEDAVEAFYRRYFDWLYAQARRACRRDEAACLDVVQDAVLRVLRTVRRTESEAQFRAWLRLVLQTTALDRWRSEHRRKGREAIVVAGRSEMEIAQEDSDESQRQWLTEQLAAFDPELVRIIELRFQQRWSLRRIGELFGLSIGTIDGRLRRAIKELRDKASEDFDD